VQILRDMQGPAPMMRLLQGDVGSGKTAVALLALLAAAGSGWQGALMAPTEVTHTHTHCINSPSTLAITDELSARRSVCKYMCMHVSLKSA